MYDGQVRLRGYRYDLRTLDSPAGYLLAQEGMAKQRGKPSAFAPFMAGQHFGRVVRCWERDIHETHARRGDPDSPVEHVCTCGLVMPDEDPLACTGHLDLRRWTVATSLVVGHRSRLTAACQACGWSAPADDLATAHEAAAQHACELPEVPDSRRGVDAQDREP